MKNEVLYLLLDRYAEHEMVFLASGITCGERGLKPEPKFVNRIVAPTLDAVVSCGGFGLHPDYSFATMPEEYAALILVGGYGWLQHDVADRVVPIVRHAIDHGKIVGAICNAASFLARHGFLNNIRHTGNGLEQLKLWGGENYTNESGYVNEQSVTDHNIVTANGTGYLEFARDVLLLLADDTPMQIEMFYRFNKDGLVKMMKNSTN